MNVKPPTRYFSSGRYERKMLYPTGAISESATKLSSRIFMVVTTFRLAEVETKAHESAGLLLNEVAFVWKTRYG